MYSRGTLGAHDPCDVVKIGWHARSRVIVYQLVMDSFGFSGCVGAYSKYEQLRIWIDRARMAVSFAPTNRPVTQVLCKYSAVQHVGCPEQNSIGFRPFRRLPQSPCRVLVVSRACVTNISVCYTVQYKFRGGPPSPPKRYVRTYVRTYSTSRDCILLRPVQYVA